MTTDTEYGFFFDENADVLSYDQWDWDSEIPQWARDMAAGLDREERINKLVELWLKEELDDVDGSISNWQDVDSMCAALVMFTTQEEDEEAARREIAILKQTTHYASGAPYSWPGYRVRLSEPIL